jgi:hypothetical protein
MRPSLLLVGGAENVVFSDWLLAYILFGIASCRRLAHALGRTPSEASSSRLTIQQQTPTIQHQPIPTLCNSPSNIPSSFQPPQLQESLIRPNSLSNQLGTSSLSLGSDDNTLFLLNSLIDQECSSLSNLLSDLFRFYGVSEFGRECDVGDGDVV